MNPYFISLHFLLLNAAVRGEFKHPIQIDQLSERLREIAHEDNA